MASPEIWVTGHSVIENDISISMSIYFVQKNNNNTIKWQKEQDNKAYGML